MEIFLKNFRNNEFSDIQLVFSSHKKLLMEPQNEST